jgi:hypothetical protein
MTRHNLTNFGLRSIFRAALLATMIVALAACDLRCGSTSSGEGQHLVFTGPAAGTLTTANVDCHLFNKQTQFNALITGKLGDKDLTLNIQVHGGYKGSGTYKVGSILDGSGEVRLQVGDWVGSSPTGAGTLIINSDGKSGVVDANLGDFEHVTGSFRCKEVVTG